MKHVKYFSKRPDDSSVKQFSSKDGYVRRFSAAKGEITLSSIDPDKYYLYKDSNVTLPGFAIDQGEFITSSSRFSRGYKLTKAYGPFDTAADAEAYANESGINLIDTTAPVEEPQPEVAEMSGTDESKFSELEAKVDALTDLVTKLTEKLSEPKEEVKPEETPVEEEPAPAEETPVEEEFAVEENSAEDKTPEQEDTPVAEETLAEESSEDICPICGCDPCICEESNDSADNGMTEEDVGLGEQVPANTGDVDTFYTQVPEEDILAQFSNSNKPEPEHVAAMSNSGSATDSMFSVLFR